MCELPLSGLSRLRINSDGPGIRTLIGTYGCPLRCKYCINPHSWKPDSYVRCVTPRQLYDEVSVDNLYFQTTGGGLTVGGGEPLLHVDALESFLNLCPVTWSLWVETSLAVEREKVMKASWMFHHFFVDMKSLDPEIYHNYTGGKLEIAYENLRALLAAVGPDRITVRLPMIPGYSDQVQQQNDQENLAKMGIVHFDLFTYQTERNREA